MNDLILNVYDKDDNVTKTCSAQFVELKYGAIRSFMRLLNVDNIDNNLDLMKAIYDAWEKLTEVLGQCFPDMEEGDWDNIHMSELVPVVVAILKESFGKLMQIPKEKNS